MPHPTTIGVIDIGTNSVLLTVARRAPDGGYTAVTEEAHITRIGEGLGHGQRFTDAAMARTAAVLGRYATICRDLGTDAVYAMGTAAFRKAENADVFVAQIAATYGLTIEIIPGTHEAELSYRAAAQDFGDEVLVLDIGGGSTEFIWRDAAGELQTHSLPIGSVVLEEQCVHSDPISDADYDQLLRRTRGLLQSVGRGAHAHPPRLIALAGTATTLGAMHLGLQQYSHAQVHGLELHITELITLHDRLRAATIAERRTMPGLEAARADVILSGTILLLETMRQWTYDRVTISDRGLRWGKIYECLAGP